MWILTFVSAVIASHGTFDSIDRTQPTYKEQAFVAPAGCEHCAQAGATPNCLKECGFMSRGDLSGQIEAVSSSLTCQNDFAKWQVKSSLDNLLGLPKTAQCWQQISKVIQIPAHCFGMPPQWFNNCVRQKMNLSELQTPGTTFNSGAPSIPAIR